MKKIFYCLISLTILTSCKSAEIGDTNSSIEISQNITEEINTNETITKENSVDEVLTENTIDEELDFFDYDFTELKGSYPKIKNDSPFTKDELKILQNSSGIEYDADVVVAHYFKYFLRDKRDMINLWISNANPYISNINTELAESSLPKEFIFLPFLESGYNVNAHSRAGAVGIWQFMSRTAQSYGLEVNIWQDERRNPFIATKYAIKHLNYLNSIYKDWYLTLAAYNAGQGRISNALKNSNSTTYFELVEKNAIPIETSRYVPQFIAITKIMNNLEVLGFSSLQIEYENNFTKFKIPGGTDLINFASALNLSWKEFSRYNPHFRKKVNNPSHKGDVFIPINKIEIAKNYIATAVPILSDSGYTTYTIQSGDSWWYLAQLSERSISDLKKLNNINTNNLKIGQVIMLPGLNLSIKNEKQEQTVEYISTGNLETYTIKEGDTISSISIKYNIKLNSLYRENNLTSKSIIHIGQVIRLPGYPIEKETSNLYTVKEGDSLWLIAQKKEIPYSKLLELNNLSSNSKLNIGDKIRLY